MNLARTNAWAGTARSRPSRRVLTEEKGPLWWAASGRQGEASTAGRPLFLSAGASCVPRKAFDFRQPFFGLWMVIEKTSMKLKAATLTASHTASTIPEVRWRFVPVFSPRGKQVSFS